MSRRINQERFSKIKGSFIWRTTNQVAAKHDISYKTAAQIKASKNYDMYREQVKAQHPEIQYSLADNVKNLHSIVFNKHDNNYIAPPTARKAVQELKLHFLAENRK